MHKLIGAAIAAAALTTTTLTSPAAAVDVVSDGQTIRYGEPGWERGWFGVSVAGNRTPFGDWRIRRVSANHGEGTPVDGVRIQLLVDGEVRWVRTDDRADVKGGQTRRWRSVEGLVIGADQVAVRYVVRDYDGQRRTMRVTLR